MGAGEESDRAAEGMAREATAACGYGVKVIPKRADIELRCQLAIVTAKAAAESGVATSDNSLRGSVLHAAYRRTVSVRVLEVTCGSVQLLPRQYNCGSTSILAICVRKRRGHRTR